MRIVACPAVATVLKIGFNLDQKMGITPTMSQLRLCLLEVALKVCGSDNRICLMVVEKCQCLQGIVIFNRAWVVKYVGVCCSASIGA
jgi:hypothetical protein